MARILIVDDEPKLGAVLVEMLDGAGHDATRAGGGRDAIARIEHGDLDVVVTDLRMPRVDGMAVLRAARTAAPGTDVVMMTAHATVQNAVDAMREGAVDYLVKPFAMEELRMRIARIVARRDLARRADALARTVDRREGFGHVIADSDKMRDVVAQARRVADTDQTVLLLGDSGTGKSLLARAIHHASKRATGPFVEVHAAALPEALVEDELFGRDDGEGGAARPGRAEAAAGGTLFLDEIGELAASTQGKLLRLVHDRTFTRLGATQPRTTDARIIAATNRDLAAEVAAGRFREDLYYRLAVFPLVIPPLRERRDDIGATARSLLAARGMADRITDAAMAALLGHDWPGNVRELENAVSRAAVLAGNDPIDVDHLAPLGRAGQPTTAVDGLLVPGFSIDALERELIQTAIVKVGGNKAAAARLLGITRRRLYSRLDSIAHGRLEPPDDDG
jgi:DNA-binding NtrC family response regulator